MGKFFNFVAVIYVLRMFMPIFGLIPSSLVLLMGVLLIFLMMSYNGTSWFFSSIKQIAPLFLLLFILDNICRVEEDKILFALYAHSLLMVLPFLMLHIIRNNDMALAKLMFYVVLFSIFITAVTTYFGCINFPQVSRMMAAGVVPPEMESQIRYLNIGDFDTIYIFVLAIPFLAQILKSSVSNYFLNCVILMTIGAIILAVFQSEYTTAVLFLFISMSSFFLPSGCGWKSILKYMVIVGIVISIIWSSLPPLLSYFSTIVESDNIRVRLEDLSIMMTGQDAGENSDAQGRFELILMNIDAYLSSPIIGIQERVGGHSFITDMMSYYGSIGIILTIMLIKKLRKIFVQPFETSVSSSGLILSEIVYLCFLILNPRLYLIVPLFFAPIFCMFYNVKMTNSK